MQSLFKFIEKNRIVIGIVLILIILVGSFLLIFQQRNGNIFCANEDKAINTLKTENDNLKNQISDLEKQVNAKNNNENGTVASASTSIGDLININTADSKALDSLSGIGAVRAQQIIDYRNAHNGFKNIEEIKNVSGIGDSTFNKIKDKITVN
jgi:competence protein ComEA